LTKEDESNWIKKWYETRSNKAIQICEIISRLTKEKNENRVILDLGCYDGKMEKYFTNHTSNLIIGIDIEFEELKKANMNSKKNHNVDIEYIRADAASLPLKDNFIDWIICNQTIDSLKNKEGVMSELDRTLGENGTIYLSVLSKSFLKFYKLFKKILIPHLGLFYGRVYPSLNSPYVLAMSYNFWKHKIVKDKKLTINDITSSLIQKTIEKDESYNKINLNSANKIYSIFARFSPSWVFILYKKTDD
jgi:ubiquinone/menaquinone biosynthesis C-methylase UbiE